MNFASDNWAGASSKVSAALAAMGQGFSPAYGADEHSNRVKNWFSEIFECETRVFFVATGTAANSLSLAAMAKPGGLVLCHAHSHIQMDECGAPEFLSGGQKLLPIPGAHGKLSADAVGAVLDRYDPANVHGGRPVGLSLTQASEAGTIYALDDIRALSAEAHKRGLKVHMDGARFANALATLNVSPADMTWRQGVDVLSFGGTKNGCWCAEAIVFFDLDLAEGFEFVRKRSGQLFSKSAFVAAQFEAYFEHGHWLDNAVHANQSATRLAQAIETSGGARLVHPVEANEIFAIWPKGLTAHLKAAGANFYLWEAPDALPGEGPGADEDMVRLVTSFATRPSDVARFMDALNQYRA
ncbi:Low specificity L-threonine aldolase [Hartmannibacter diazotrophicus]|uniref:L-threonine aldolase n=1 Tax=Hartmannibacter diazotrophicus TaxID=1482074 RepID=A0A2C9DDA8_9HYPH|nr:low specificity L-threonine aldolase [Hartmannibacter diazotrophicus]SON57605.1 Low specificity L-threonine aldolase [Hartmannibacter diazotrophicus]